MKYIRPALGTLLVLTQACVASAPTLWPSPSSLDEGIPHQPALVTVVPFQYAAPFVSWYKTTAGFILIPAEIDGHQGTFLLDTGASGIVLNPSYLQPSQTGGIDTVHNGIRRPCPRPIEAGNRCHVTVQTLRVGTLRQTLAAPDRAPTVTNQLTNGRFPDSTDQRLTQFGRPVLGWLGPRALESFETIIDYPHQRVIFVRLDAKGRRMVDLPAFTSVDALPLIPQGAAFDRGYIGWHVVATIGTEVDTVLLDTGAPHNVWKWNDQEEERLTQHPNPGLEDLPMTGMIKARQMEIASQTFENVYFEKGFGDWVLGFPFFRHLGVVGFNFRAHQLSIYR